MPFIAAEELPKMELFPGALSGIVAGEASDAVLFGDGGRQ